MFILTVILSEIDAVNNEAACCIPARKLAGAAIAAASNKRLMVMPPVVTATTESRLLCPPEDATVWLADVRAGGKIPKGALAKWFPPLYEIQGAKLAKMSAPKVPK